MPRAVLHHAVAGAESDLSTLVGLEPDVTRKGNQEGHPAARRRRIVPGVGQPSCRKRYAAHVRTNLSIEQLGDLLDLPLVSTLATYRKNGSVLLSPVWHEWRDGGFYICAGSRDVKARHIRRYPRGSLVVYDQRPPYRGLELRATPRLLEDGALYAAVLRSVAVRYLGEAAGTTYADSAGERGLVIRLEPGELRTWDFTDDFS